MVLDEARESLAAVETSSRRRLIESAATATYWSAWTGLRPRFPLASARRTPPRAATGRGRVPAVTEFGHSRISGSAGRGCKRLDGIAQCCEIGIWSLRPDEVAMFAPVARLLDMHVCPMQTPAIIPIPHVGGPVVGPGAPTVFAGLQPVAVVGDFAVCFGPPDSFVAGSTTVLAMGKPVARISDTTAHGGMVLVGMPTVLVGDSGGAGSAAGQTMSAAKAGGSAFARTDCEQKSARATAQNVPPEPPVTGTGWVEVEVVDNDGRPLPYQKVQVTDSEGTQRTAFSNAQGIARMNGMVKGACKITLADFDKSSWEPL